MAKISRTKPKVVAKRHARGGQKQTRRQNPVTRVKPASEANTTLRAGTKLSKVVKLLSGVGGASISELTTQTGWLPHTTRAALTGLRKRGFAIDAQRGEHGTIYRLILPQSGGGKHAGADAAAKA